MKGKKTISRVDRNIRNNLVKFADNLPLSYFKAPQKQQRLDEKWVKSATEWKFIIQNTPSCSTSRIMKNNWSYYSPNVIIFLTLRFFKNVFGFFINLTSMHRWNHLHWDGIESRLIKILSHWFIRRLIPRCSRSRRGCSNTWRYLFRSWVRGAANFRVPLAPTPRWVTFAYILVNKVSKMLKSDKWCY